MTRERMSMAAPSKSETRATDLDALPIDLDGAPTDFDEEPMDDRWRRDRNRCALDRPS
jgi:hypothetical protein